MYAKSGIRTHAELNPAVLKTTLVTYYPRVLNTRKGYEKNTLSFAFRITQNIPRGGSKHNIPKRPQSEFRSHYLSIYCSGSITVERSESN